MSVDDGIFLYSVKLSKFQEITGLNDIYLEIHKKYTRGEAYSTVFHFSTLPGWLSNGNASIYIHPVSRRPLNA